MNPSVKSTRENSLLDLLKFICAYLVVAVHSTPVETAFGMAVLDAVHMAVPPFFMISGYLLRGNGEPLDATRFRARIVRLLKMTAIWMLVYLCASTLLVFVGRGWIPGLTAPRAWYRQLTSVETWLKFVLIQFVPGIGYHLWYLPASIIGLLLLGAVHRLHLQKCRLGLAVVIMAGQIALTLYGNYAGLGLNSSMIRNAWLTAFPFLMLGDWVRDHEDALRARIPSALLAALVVAGLVVPSFEFWWGGTTEYFLGNYVAAIAAFLLAAQLGQGFSRPWGRWMRDASLFVYLWHMMFVQIFDILFDYVLHPAPFWHWLITPMSFCLSLGLFECKRRLTARCKARKMS